MFSKILNVNHPSLVSFPHLDIFFFLRKLFIPNNFVHYFTLSRSSVQCFQLERCSQSDLYLAWTFDLLFQCHSPPPVARQGIPPNACDNPGLEDQNTIVSAPGCQEPIKTIWSLTPGCSLWRVVSISASPRFHQGLQDRPGGQYHAIKATQSV